MDCLPALQDGFAPTRDDKTDSEEWRKAGIRQAIQLGDRRWFLYKARKNRKARGRYPKHQLKRLGQTAEHNCQARMSKCAKSRSNKCYLYVQTRVTHGRSELGKLGRKFCIKAKVRSGNFSSVQKLNVGFERLFDFSLSLPYKEDPQVTEHAVPLHLSGSNVSKSGRSYKIYPAFAKPLTDPLARFCASAQGV